MEKLTVEQKAKAYDEALKRARIEYKNEQSKGNIWDCESLSTIFPELVVESEDERIRKGIMDFIDTKTIDSDERRNRWFSYLEKYKPIPFVSLEDTKVKMSLMQYILELNQDVVHLHPGIETCNEWIAWLEKQGEQNPADKLEPKFHKGEWIVWKDKCYKVNYNGCGYELVDQDGLSMSLEYGTINENAHIWDVTTDAKDGDVLACNDNPFLFLKYEKDEYGLVCCSYCGISNSEYGKFAVNTNTKKYWCDIEFVNPATKEQRDILFQKMHEAGWEFDFDKKVLKKIEQEPTDNDIKEALRTEYEKGRADAIAEIQNPVDCIDCTNSKGCINCEDGNMKETLVQKTAWSEEDEEFLRRAINATKDVYPMTAKWLKFLKDRVQSKQEWSKKDNQYLCGLIGLIEQSKAELPITLKGKAADNCIDWLKSLKPQNRWKPTELQMDVLLDEVNAWTKGCPKQKVLESLYNDLKKLMEE